MKIKKFSLIFLATLSVFGLVFVNTAFGEDAVFLFSWGSVGTGDGQFGPHYTAGIAKDSQGNVYVADNENNRIQKFTSNGTFTSKWGSHGTGNGQFNSPVGIAIDSLDNVYVTDWYNRRVQKFTSGGIYLMQWGSQGSGVGQFNVPQDIAIDSAGIIYVSDTYNSRIQKFTSDGAYLGQWGNYGLNDGQFRYINGLAIDTSDNVYVCDHLNHRIQKFTKEGVFITKWGSFGHDLSQFNYPVGIEVDSLNNIYVGDQHNHRIQKFTSEGDYLYQWGSEGSSNGQFRFPAGIMISISGEIYVVDSWNSRVQVFGISTFGNYPPDISLNGDGSYEVGTSIKLSARVSDIDGDILSFVWKKLDHTISSGTVQALKGGEWVSLPEIALLDLPVGTHLLTLQLSDGINDLVSKDIIINIIDDIKPSLTSEVDKTVLWPPNHKMVPINIDVNASDNSGQHVSLSASVSCNESPKKSEKFWNGPIIDNEQGMIKLDLLAERFGKGLGRICTITITGTDASGNSDSTSLNITVPHDMRKN